MQALSNDLYFTVWSQDKGGRGGEGGWRSGISNELSRAVSRLTLFDGMEFLAFALFLSYNWEQPSMTSLANIPNVEKPVRQSQGHILSNHTQFESRAYQSYAAASVCLFVIVIFAALRLYAKLFLFRSHTWDDC